MPQQAGWRLTFLGDRRDLFRRGIQFLLFHLSALVSTTQLTAVLSSIAITFINRPDAESTDQDECPSLSTARPRRCR
jgi:hypothetical protein